MNLVALDPAFGFRQVSLDMRRYAMRVESFQAFPSFDKDEAARLLHIAVHLVLKHAVFFVNGREQAFERVGQLLLVARLCKRDGNRGYLGHGVLLSTWKKERRGYTRASENKSALA